MRRFREVRSILVALAAIMALAVGAWAQELDLEGACKAAPGYTWGGDTPACYSNSDIHADADIGETACNALAGEYAWNEDICLADGATAVTDVALLCSLAPGVSWVSDKCLTNISNTSRITGVRAPVGGRVPWDEDDLSLAGGTVGFTVTSVVWHYGSNFSSTLSGNFIGGTIYRATILLTATVNENTFIAGGYTSGSFFAGSTVGGDAVGTNGTTLTLTVTFPSATPPDIVLLPADELGVPVVYGHALPAEFLVHIDNQTSDDLGDPKVILVNATLNGVAISSDALDSLFVTEPGLEDLSSSAIAADSEATNFAVSAAENIRLAPGEWSLEYTLEYGDGEWVNFDPVAFTVTAIEHANIEFEKISPEDIAPTRFKMPGALVTMAVGNVDDEIGLDSVLVKIAGITRNNDPLDSNEIDFSKLFNFTNSVANNLLDGSLAAVLNAKGDAVEFTIRTTDETPSGVYVVTFGIQARGLYTGSEEWLLSETTVSFTVTSVVPDDIALATDSTLVRTFSSAVAPWIPFRVTNNKTEHNLNAARVTISRIMRGEAEVNMTADPNQGHLFEINTGFVGVGTTAGAALNSGATSTFQLRNQPTVAPGEYRIFLNLDAATGVCNGSGVVNDNNGLEFGPIAFTINPAPVTNRIIGGITVPAGGALYLGGDTITHTPQSQYKGTVKWEPELVNGRFMPHEVYTAIVTLTAARGFTFYGVGEDALFTAAGGVTAHEANSGIVRVTFPATQGAQAVSMRNITRPAPAADHPILPTRRSVPWYDALGNVQFSVDQETITWDPPVGKCGDTERFEAATAYTVSMKLSPMPGFTFAGMLQPFTIAGAASTDFDIETGIFSATFPATAAPMVVGTAVTSDAGDLRNFDNATAAQARSIRRPGFVTGETPFESFGFAPRAGEIGIDSVWGVQFTGKVTWSPAPADGRFESGEVYTANIALTPKIGYTFEGIAENQLTVMVSGTGAGVGSATGVTTTHEASSGEVAAVFSAVANAVTITTASNGMQIRGLAQPATGEIPSTVVTGGLITATGGRTFTGTVEWSPGLTNGRFDAGVSYTAIITVEPEPGYTFVGMAANAAFTTSATGVQTPGGITHEFPGENIVKIAFTGTNPYTVAVSGTPVEVIANHVVMPSGTAGPIIGVPGSFTLPVTTTGVPAGWYETEIFGTTISSLNGVTLKDQVWIDNAGRGELVVNSAGAHNLANASSLNLRLVGGDVNIATTTVFAVTAVDFVAVTGAVLNIATNDDKHVTGTAVNFVNLPFNLSNYGRFNTSAQLQPYQSAAWMIDPGAIDPDNQKEAEAVNARVVVDAAGDFWLHADDVGTIHGLAVLVTCATASSSPCVEASLPVTGTIVARAVNTRFDYSYEVDQMANMAASRVISIPNVVDIFNNTVSYDVEKLHIEDRGWGTVTAASVDVTGNTLTFSVDEFYRDGQSIIFTLPLVSSVKDNDRLVVDDKLTLTVNFISAPSATKPGTGTLNYTTEMLAGFTADRAYIVELFANDVYTVVDTVVADADGEFSIAKWINAPTAAGGQGATTVIHLTLIGEVGDYVQEQNSPRSDDISIKGRRAAPAVTVSRIDDHFSAMSVTTAQSYQNLSNPGQGWIKVTEGMLSNEHIAVQNGGYEVRIDATESEFVSATRTVLVGIDTMVEPTPVIVAAHINYAQEVVRNTAASGIVTGRTYMVLVDGTEFGEVTATNSSIAIDSDWMGSSISLILLARDENFENSLPSAALAIPARPAAPSVTAGNGRIEGVTAAMEYRLATAATWTSVTSAQETAGSVTVSAGDYQVRYRAVASGANAAFASSNTAVSVGQVSVAEVEREDPTGQTNDVATFVPVRAASKFAVGPSPVVIGGVVNFFGHNGIGSLRIFDATGSVVREVKVADGWDLKDARGRYVAEGTYVVRGVLTINGERVRVSAPVTVVK